MSNNKDPPVRLGGLHQRRLTVQICKINKQI